jgi:hypothetical protein
MGWGGSDHLQGEDSLTDFPEHVRLEAVGGPVVDCGGRRACFSQRRSGSGRTIAWPRTLIGSGVARIIPREHGLLYDDRLKTSRGLRTSCPSQPQQSLQLAVGDLKTPVSDLVQAPGATGQEVAPSRLKGHINHGLAHVLDVLNSRNIVLIARD